MMRMLFILLCALFFLFVVWSIRRNMLSRKYALLWISLSGGCFSMMLFMICMDQR
ncbi:hypothetical protein PAECIP111893_02124 [Paenibacillus plantiphilus]|uniref:Uncharacterized protein n=1 Tax=Paenibacillus plantiphilus TaxID=2905650 RepID=A0ABN8G9W6_9BACL|nr:DUF2304 family protein [Paenibacillus plantiphilus]CAH1204093.1 hypothetical protein PAECIP111893_02124 [Paenibacillus plantiphilus]